MRILPAEFVVQLYKTASSYLWWSSELPKETVNLEEISGYYELDVWAKFCNSSLERTISVFTWIRFGWMQSDCRRASLRNFRERKPLYLIAFVGILCNNTVVATNTHKTEIYLVLNLTFRYTLYSILFIDAIFVIKRIGFYFMDCL